MNVLLYLVAAASLWALFRRAEASQDAAYELGQELEARERGSFLTCAKPIDAIKGDMHEPGTKPGCCAPAAPPLRVHEGEGGREPPEPQAAP